MNPQHKPPQSMPPQQRLGQKMYAAPPPQQQIQNFGPPYHHPRQPILPQQQQMIVPQQAPANRLLDLFEAMKHEFEAVTDAINMYKMQRDEYELKRKPLSG